jgi:hypothetical protein
VNFRLTLTVVSNKIIDLASKTINFSAENLYHPIEPDVAMSFEYLDIGRTYVRDASGSFV